MNSNLHSEHILCLQLMGYAPSRIFKTTEESFRTIIRKEGAKELLDKASALLKRQEELGILTLPFHHPDFPESLRQIGHECPPLIHLLGNKSLLTRDSVAIIGARKADRRGCAVAYKWGAEYAQRGKVVVSGLAAGCDAAAHRGCLDSRGGTIAIVATGLDITHPRENKNLQERILGNGGLLLSEQIIGVKANPTRLVARNRLQAALSEEIIVAQCPEHSGTMHTVRFAKKYGKKIYAVRYGRYGEESSGNQFLIDEGIAMPI